MGLSEFQGLAKEPRSAYEEQGTSGHGSTEEVLLSLTLKDGKEQSRKEEAIAESP